jgi:hypothetical protein
LGTGRLVSHASRESDRGSDRFDFKSTSVAGLCGPLLYYDQAQASTQTEKKKERKTIRNS